MRPTKYTKAIQQKADWYVNGGYLECGDVVPSRSGLACELNVTRQTLANWEEHEQFLDTLEKLAAVQERVTLSGGLKGELNSSIVKLLLANHGYSEKRALAHSSTNNNWLSELGLSI